MAKKVLFVCVENSCRSQIAEAFGKMLGRGVMEVHSSGSRPSGKVNEKAVAAIKEVGYDLSTHNSKSLEEIPDIEWDLVVTMGCGDECPYVRARERQDWEIPDPKDMDMGGFRQIRDVIRDRVMELAEKFKAE